MRCALRTGCATLPCAASALGQMLLFLQHCFQSKKVKAVPCKPTIHLLLLLLALGPAPLLHAQSSGLIRVFFTRPVDTAYSTGSLPDGIGGNAVEQAIIDLIDQATETIDYCVYNTSRTFIVNALKAAHQRGVRVRVLTDNQTWHAALDPPPPFPVFYGSPGDGIMHNKFIVIDANQPDKAWVVTGSMNFTHNNIFEDYNNVLFIQDGALAQAYTTEFEEMWGGDGPQPDYGQARFGQDKTNNTPHQFVIGGVPVECYFSPSDLTASHIIDALQAAQHDIQVAMWIFTDNALSDALVQAYQQGIDLRAIIDQGDEYAYLLQQGLPVTNHPPQTMIHHKYAIIDAQQPGPATAVVTGSHNWTWSADHINDENTLILYDADLANLFLQEFEARWHELVTATSETAPLAFRCYPNPATDLLFFEGLPQGPLTWALLSTDGRMLEGGRLPLGAARQLRVSHLPKGTYWLLVRLQDRWWRTAVVIQ